MLRRLFICAITISAINPAFASDFGDNDVNIAIEALELFYVKNGVYSAVECKSLNYEDRTFIRCYPIPDQVPGGLWVVEAGPEIFALNGKALQLFKKTGGELSDVHGRPVSVRDWRTAHSPNQMIDIPTILEKFGAPR